MLECAQPMTYTGSSYLVLDSLDLQLGIQTPCRTFPFG